MRSTMIQRIIHNDSLISIILKAGYSKDGITFFTPNELSQQLAYMKRPEGYIIEAHVHNAVPREVVYTKETLFIKSGRVRVDFYDSDKKYAGSTIVEGGDVVLLVDGGHGFEMLEQSEIIEVKQGPYLGEKDKTHFKSISAEEVWMHRGNGP